MKILIIKTSSMGDIIHTLPALTDAKKILSNTSFDWVIEKNFSEIPMWHSGTRHIIPSNIKVHAKNYLDCVYWKKYNNFIHKLQKNTYDIIIDAQGLIKIAFLITNLAKGKKHGMNSSSIREPIASIFYNKKHQIHKNQHAIERTRQLFSKALKYPQPSETGCYNIKNYFKKKQNTEPYLIFLHSASKKKKTWPEIYWRTLTRFAIHEGFHVKFPWWKTTEYLRAKRLTQGLAHVEILPKLTLTQIAKQILGATAIISIDTGLSHLSAALHTPNLTLYGPTNPALIGTYGKNQKKIYSKTQSMIDIKPIETWNTFKQLLNQIKL
ncbi:Lipopolysaccharide heptosyltransferase 1 [Blochmannia endosymbiont of Camponotus (Colobopsis) obliquus]|nr:Lipopolysaccharide heptosyltransferase 1 [Blochmannia endosymbiont of Camponotus (Colobopsis) obliquus]